MDIAQLINEINPIAIIITGASVALVLLIIGIAITVTAERKTLELERLGRYIEEDEILSEKERSTPLTDWLNRRVEKSSIGERISQDLSRADLKFKPGEYIALYVISIVGLAMISYLIRGRILLSAIIGGIIGS
ncbi:MAG: hypothetical protein HGB14_07060, partial [Anaerolineaceae bacterium]|nr:hypothetical protein [Anaerolineaceae bacterium]